MNEMEMLELEWSSVILLLCATEMCLPPLLLSTTLYHSPLPLSSTVFYKLRILYQQRHSLSPASTDTSTATASSTSMLYV